MVNSSPYSRLDRALHNLAFSSSILDNILEDIEKLLYAKTWQNAAANNPVFITSLPRAGTTIILEVLHRLPGLATHTYRDMPFLFTPVLWNRLSAGIRKKSVLRERAHGDGLEINEDSPEAFEEALWRKYFPNHYTDQGINLWNTTSSQFTDYFHQHMQKIVSLRCVHGLNCRYLSKNNCNIARINAINAMFPNSSVIVPLRNPVEHAISLWRQHNNFLELHAHDDFVRKYMADIGHYEFGVLHRPIQFPGIGSLIHGLDPESLNYWIAYWIAAYEYLAEQNNIILLSYEDLCQYPYQSINTLCQHIELKVTAEEISAAASIIKSSPPGRRSKYNCDQALTERANNLYHKLLGLCLLKK